MGFQSIINSLTTFFQDIADTNSLTVRYDNDPRTTPSSGIWCEFGIDFGDSQQKEIGINSYRNIGNVVVKIKNSMGLGLSDLFVKADIIATAFRVVEIDNIIFKVPRIVKVGKVEDDYQVNVICPFYIDN